MLPYTAIRGTKVLGIGVKTKVVVLVFDIVTDEHGSILG